MGDHFRLALARGEINRQDLPASALMDTDRDQDRPGPNNTLLTDLLVAGIENQVGIRLFQTPLGKGREGLIEPLVEDADAGGREAVPAELLRDRFDLAGGDALHVHLRQGGYEGLLRALVALKEGGLELAAAVPGYPQFELAGAGHQAAFIMAGPVALAAFLASWGPAPRKSVISASKTSWRASFIKDFIRARSSATRVLRSIALMLGFFTVMAWSLLTGYGVD